MTLKITAKDESTQRILEAASYGDIDYLKKLPGSSIVITARCSSGCTALHWAAGCNQVKMILYLVNEVAMNVDTRATKKANGRTPLHYSCRNGCLEASKLLVKLGTISVLLRLAPFSFGAYRYFFKILLLFIYPRCYNTIPTFVRSECEC